MTLQHKLKIPLACYYSFRYECNSVTKHDCVALINSYYRIRSKGNNREKLFPAKIFFYNATLLEKCQKRMKVLKQKNVKKFSIKKFCVFCALNKILFCHIASMDSVAIWLEVLGEPTAVNERTDRRVIRNSSNIMGLCDQR